MIRLTRAKATAIPIILACGMEIGGFLIRAQFNDTRPLASFVPPGAKLYLEAKDFRKLLSQWNSSAEKRKWLSSENFRAVSMSRLIQRLAEAETQFETVAGVGIQMNLLDEVAGGRSAFAFYDFGKLNFVYLSEVGRARIEASSFWRNRTAYQAREVSGIPFFVKTDTAAGRTVAFCQYRDWFAVATDEDRMAQTLQLLAGKRAASLTTENWFNAVIKTATAPSDLRLVYSLDSLLATPQFRTYWIQRNATELKAFSSGISGLTEQQNGFDEQRTMLKKMETTPALNDAAMNEALQYVPAAHSLYRAWATPDAVRLREVLQQVVFGEPTGVFDMGRIAPEVNTEAPVIGSVTDLETRIDEPPFQRNGQPSIENLAKAVEAMQPLALLHVQVASVLHDDVFVMPSSGLVLICKNANGAALSQALGEVTSMAESGSLDPLSKSVAGNTIVLTRLTLTRQEPFLRPQAGATYVAGYNNRQEWPHYKKLFGLVDQSLSSPEMAVRDGTPPFFSGNVRSFGDALSRFESASIQSVEKPQELQETVAYRLSSQ